FNEKKNLFLLTGCYTEENLQEVLDKFILEFLLCKTCGNPETEYKVAIHTAETEDFSKKNVSNSNKKKNCQESSLYLHCNACGKDSLVDSKSKIVEMIIKDHLNELKLTNKKSKQKADNKSTNENFKKKIVNDDSTKLSPDSGIEYEKEEEEDDDTDWALDINEDSVKARQEENRDLSKVLDKLLNLNIEQISPTTMKRETEVLFRRDTIFDTKIDEPIF
ncbi:hypothetical protein HK099_003048, partial [Clydaea vesicula]